MKNKSAARVAEEEKLKAAELKCQTELASELSDYYDRLEHFGELDEDARARLSDDISEKAAELKQRALGMKLGYQTCAVAADELETRMKELLRSSRKKKGLLKPAPANSVIDIAEREKNSFARGMNLYKLLLLVFIGSFVGVILEMFWCLITNGYIESRAGLVWGPFNLLYGVGAAALTAALYPYRNRNAFVSFIGGAVVGSVVEYACSFFQELCFGSTSWDYTNFPFNLDGRICLVFSVIWGLLGVVWIKSVYPRMAKWILKIPNKVGKIIVWSATIFLIIDAAASCVTVFRWSERVRGEPPSNAFEEFLDERFPDERMEYIFANMEFGEKK